jgi:hypothetical protein
VAQAFQLVPAQAKACGYIFELLVPKLLLGNEKICSKKVPKQELGNQKTPP